MGVLLTPIAIKQDLALEDLRGKRFAVDANGELYAMVTNTPSNGSGGIVYKLLATPEPSSCILLSFGLGRLALTGSVFHPFFSWP